MCGGLLERPTDPETLYEDFKKVMFGF
jgi:hypothetical protein